MVRKPTVISTFAGCGGSSLGYQMAGFKELLAVEWEDNAAETFKLNFPKIPLFHGDIKELSVEECLKLAKIKPKELDVFDGSPPCQGFSTAGERKFHDPRNSLFKEYCRLLKGLQPKVFVMENVSGMVKGVMKQAYLKIVTELRDCGYQVKGELLNAKYFGVPQSRERVIIIGVRKDLKIKPSHPKPNKKVISVKEALHIINSKRFAKTLPKFQEEIWEGKKRRKNYAFGYFKLSPRKPAPTIIKNTQGHMHYEEKRILSIEELQVLQSFPISFKFLGSFSAAWARIGNSVPPLLMKAIAVHIKEEILK